MIRTLEEVLVGGDCRVGGDRRGERRLGDGCVTRTLGDILDCAISPGELALTFIGERRGESFVDDSDPCS